MKKYIKLLIFLPIIVAVIFFGMIILLFPSISHSIMGISWWLISFLLSLFACAMISEIILRIIE